jgi:hypothetical protein
MRREYGIPIVLWICAAAWLHTLAGGGGYFAAELHDGKSFVSNFGNSVRARVRQGETVVELDPGDGEATPAPEPDDPSAPKDPNVVPQVVPSASVPLPKPSAPEPPKPPPAIPLPKPEAPKPLAVKPEPEKAPPKPEAKPEPAKPEVAKPEMAKPAAPAEPPKPLEPLPPVQQKLAVKQFAKPDQEDNPEAKMLSEQANRVAQETVATQTAHDQDNEHPTPGTHTEGPKDTVGNGDKTKVADSSEHAGDPDRAPGEHGTQFSIEKLIPTTAAPKPAEKADPKAAAPPKSTGDGKTASSGRVQPADNTTKPTAAAQGPEVAVDNSGGWTFRAVKPGVPTDAVAAAFGSVAPPSSKPPSPFMGLGGTPGEGRVNLNLTHQGAAVAIGEPELNRMRVADGERRLSQHRGSWQSTSLDRELRKFGEARQSNCAKHCAVAVCHLSGGHACAHSSDLRRLFPR